MGKGGRGGRGKKTSVAAAGASLRAASDAQQSSEKMITENFNLEHDAEIDEALQTILACPYFSSILTDDPIGIVKDDVADHLAGHQALSGKVRFGGSSCWILSPACTL